MMSIDELAKMTPVRPPIVNRNTNPKAHIIGASKDRWALNMVDSSEDFYSSWDCNDYCGSCKVGSSVDIYSYCKHMVGSYDEP